MSNKITGKVLSVQLSREESYLVLLGTAGEVLHSVTLPTPVGAVDDGVIRNPDAIRAMLKENLSQPAFQRVRKVVFTLCTSQVIAETVRTPNLPEAKLGKLLRANADMYFPVDTKDYQLVWQVVGSAQNQDGAKELAVQLWAVPADMLKAYYTVANGCGLSVAAIDYCGHSMASIAGASFAATQKPAKERKKLDLNMEISFGAKKKVEPAVDMPSMDESAAVETQLHLSLNKDLLGMTFVQNNQVVMQRIIRCGSQLFYQFGELAMMLEYFQSMEQGRGSVIRGFVTGFYANDRRTMAELADMLGISLELLPLPYDLSYSLCVGAARTELDFGNPGLNVVHKARREVQSQLWQYGLVLAGGLVLVAVVLFTLTARLTWNADLHRLKTQQQTLAIQAQKVAGFADNYADYLRKYNAYSSDWESIFGNLQTYNDNLVLVMDELEDMMPENSSVVGMQIGASGLGVTFACENKEEAAYLIMKLRDMKYAKLITPVSDLMGGGAGPATSYGSEDAETEEAPKEGSGETVNGVPADQWEMLKASVNTDMDPYVVGYNLGLGYRTKALLPQLKEAYGLKVENTYANMAKLREEKGVLLTYQKRADAFWQMCTTNPFAMDAADDLLMKDYTSGGKLYQYVLKRLDEEGYGPNDVYRHRSVEELQEHIELLTGIIVTYNADYDAMSDVEKLIVSDPELEAWYIYYLEAELEKNDDAPIGQDKKRLPYLDLDKLTKEILEEGEFLSADKDLNNGLYGLVSQRTLSLVESMTQQEPPVTEPPATEPPTTEPPATEPPTTVPPATEPPTTEPPATEPEEEMDSTHTNIMKLYLPGYLTKDYLPAYGDSTEKVRKVLDTYFETGKTDVDAKYDKGLDTYINSKAVDAELTALVKEYKANPDSLKNQSIRKMLDNYQGAGTGNDVLTAWIARCAPELTPPETEPPVTEPPVTEPPITEPPTEPPITEPPTEPPITEPPTEPEEELDPTYAQLLKTYLPGYLTEDYLPAYGDYTALIEAALDKFFETGASGQEAGYDKFLNDYIASEEVDEELVGLITLYNQDPDSLKNQSIRKMLDNYYKEEAKSTGNETLDEWIKRCDEEQGDYNDSISDKLTGWLTTYLTSGKTGDANGDVIIGKYVSTGKTDSEEYTKALNDYVSAGKVYAQLKNLLKIYAYNKATLTNYPNLLAMFDNYYKNSTGSTALDSQIKKAAKELANEASNSGSSGGGGGSGNQQTGPQDTRIFFAVVLNYDEELRNAELVRKGLDRSKKIPMLEVGN